MVDAKLHPESLLHIPLVRRALEDPTVRVRVRAVDARWRDRGKASRVAPGFNPFLGELFVARHSAAERWLEDPTQSARALNEGDRLLADVLFIAHDYLHVWSTRLIGELWPDLGFGAGPVTRANFEDYVFALLLTEAVATVGLDYWYLSAVELDRVVPIGPKMKAGLTTPYHERDVAEYRRFNPDLEVQRPGFFAELATFYGTGVFRGFDVADVRQSPLLKEWMQKELGYGKNQRVNSRRWLAYLSEDELALDEAALAAPVDTAAPARAELIAEVGARLWRMVKLGERVEVALPRRPPPASPVDRPADLRFRTISSISDDELFAKPRGDEFEGLLPQLLARHDFERFDHSVLPEFKRRIPSRDARLFAELFRGQPRLEAVDEPRDLLFEG